MLRSMRPHQWSKNLLLLLPVGAGHIALTRANGLLLFRGVAAFSLLASAVYIVNDLADVSADRMHPRKRDRPIAAGTLSMPRAMVLAAVCATAAVVLAMGISKTFALTLGGYAVLTTLYSLRLKRVLLVDVIVLATLYTIRVIAGAVLVDIRLTRWFLAFSIFVFFSLALVKRVRELREMSAGGAADDSKLPGRAYRPADQVALVGLGTSATMATALVYCLYITSPEAALLYHRPDALWLGLPLLIYWQARTWVFTLRDAMPDDPVAFALRDPVSWVTAFAFGCVLVLASS